MAKKDNIFGDELRLSEEFIEGETTEELESSPASALAHPHLYEVVLLNDDFTPIDYVVFVLKRFFRKSQQEAMQTALQVHNEGQATCGLYTREIAETKIMQVINLSRKNNHPLRCVMRKEA
ncbi:MAG: ATP-dependent Clp protease adapter ClpS [Proteobacteria bacterium]|nr:ATP-dependent Clp protease adapter ClpS [Pseudomonadota bacterium]